MKIKKLKKGNEKFRKKYFSKFKEDFDDLVKFGQKPKTLFIGCCDSRVVPDLIVDASPGDMFTLRNIGNFVPPFQADNDFHGTAAAIEYAVSVLNVKHIVVCGHTYCGACASLYDNIPNNESLVHVKKWLTLGEKAKNYTLENIHKEHTQDELLRATEKNSIGFQLDNLMTYPEIKRRYTCGDLQIHGWYYKIEDGSIEYYDYEEKQFIDLKR